MQTVCRAEKMSSNNINKNIPTIVAVKLAESVKLVNTLKRGASHKEYVEKMERLSMFQQMSIAVEFEDALIAFTGYQLNKKQTAVLEIIYKTTRPWMLSHVVGVLLDKIDGGMLEKDFGPATEILLRQLNANGDGVGAETPDGDKNAINGMLVRLTKAE